MLPYRNVVLSAWERKEKKNGQSLRQTSININSKAINACAAGATSNNLADKYVTSFNTQA